MLKGSWIFRVLVGSALLVSSSLASEAAPTAKIDGMYVNTFGDPSKPALIFVHGGPGYNSWDFELTTAPALAKQGYYVVVYDERGQGRSAAVDPAQYTYKRYADDLKEIIDTLHLKNPTLIGHSHGGPIAIEFERHYPGVAKKIALVSAPIDFWASMRSLFENCSRRWQDPADHELLDELTAVYFNLFENPSLPKDQLPGYVAAAFAYGMKCGLYAVKDPTPQAQSLTALLSSTPYPSPLTGMTTAMPGFLANENYVHYNALDFVAQHRDRFCGIYGDEDGLFTPLQLNLIRGTLDQPGEPERFQLVHGASHAVYIYQQQAFFGALQGVCGV